MDIDPSRIAGVNAHETAFLHEEIFVRRAYLPDGMTLPPDAVVFDVGANIGLYSLFVHAECPRATVHAFEPLPPVFEKLAENTAAYGVPATLYPCALSDTDGEVEFTYYPGYTTMSARATLAATGTDRDFIRRRVLAAPDTAGLGEDTELLDEMLDFRFREVPYVCRTRRLSDVLTEAGVDRVDMLKIDVQRAEAEVLRGVDEAHWPLIHRIALEIHDEPGTTTEGRLPTLTTELRRRGFTLTTPLDDDLVTSGRYTVFASRG
ncbi:FkbM family methyltransferase [Streptomyces catenulae]|uniref:FkbM family methyltransferase n=1 Tax=Streptomyces catenulae TaxID=66875 RepID=A0ABV2Z486_9ACTN|nr:FkbM family methyltransferase [Streptomyces catenulae]